MRHSLAIGAVAFTAILTVIYVMAATRESRKAEVDDGVVGPAGSSHELAPPKDPPRRVGVKQPSEPAIDEPAKSDPGFVHSGQEGEEFRSEEMSEAEWEAYVLAQPQWAEDDSAFEDKYRGFDDERIAKARQLIKAAIRSDEEAAIPRRLETGDYDDITGRKDGGLRKSEGQEIFMYLLKQVDNGGALQTCLFEFNEADYPWIYYRGRELHYLRMNMMKRGLSVVHNN